MNELIKINYDSDRPTVSGRDLHEALEVETPYRKWFPRMCEYGFAEGVDFNPVKNVRVQMEGERDVTREIADHQLTIPMAKELCMLQRTEKGKQFRQYFIQVEEQWNTPEAVMARALQFAEREMKRLQSDNRALVATVEKQRQAIEDFRPIQQYVDLILSSTGTLATTQIAADYDMTANRLNRILHQEGIQRKVGDQWILYHKHMGKGYTQSETIPIVRSDGRPDTVMHTKWTQKGRLLIHEILTRRGIVAVMDRK